eukprot:gene10237-21353_t
MGFKFGMISEINAGIGTATFIMVIVFLGLFDGLTELIDSLLESHDDHTKDENATYRMIQTVYKELMVMGLVSFVIVLVDTEEWNPFWILAIDFAHICLFFMAIFYVVQAALLIAFLGLIHSECREMSRTDMNKVISDIEGLEKKPWSFQSILFHRKYIIGSQIQEEAEFKIESYIFREKFSIPEEFDYVQYLTLATEEYTLKLLTMTPVNRFILIIIAGLNYARVALMKRDGVHCLDHMNYLGRSRYLSGGETLEIASHEDCALKMLDTFAIVGYWLLFWNILLKFISRLLVMGQRNFSTELLNGTVIKSRRSANSLSLQGLSSETNENRTI